jgi:hypothetical protein
MEQNQPKWNPKEIPSALEGEKNPTKEYLDSIVQYLKESQESNTYPVPTFPAFDTVWQKHLSNESKLENIETQIKTKVSLFPSYVTKWKAVSSLAVAATVLVVLSTGYFFSNKENTNGYQTYEIKITNVSGNAYILNSDGSRRVHLKSLKTIQSGDRLQVEEYSFVDLELSPQTGVRIQEKSAATLEKWIYDGFSLKSTFYLERGGILAHIHKLNKSSEFMIATKGAKVEVRGTKFLTLKTEDNLTVAVAEGKVQVFDKESKKSEDILQNEQVDWKNKNWEKSPLQPKIVQSLAELDFVSIESVPSSETQKMIQSEEDLFRIYAILERITTIEGKVIRGVVFHMDEDYIYIRTVAGEQKIPQSIVSEVEKIR